MSAAPPSTLPSTQGLQGLVQEWRANARLRAGVALIAAILVFWLLLLAHDQATLWKQQALDLQSQAEQLRPYKGQTQWGRRADEAGQLLELARELQWEAPSMGAAEARLQDALRAWTEKLGIRVLELAVLPANVAQAASAPAVADAQGQPLRLRLAVEFNRQSFMVLLAELQGAAPMLLVEHLQIKTAAQPARAELELRAQVRIEERQP